MRPMPYTIFSRLIFCFLFVSSSFSLSAQRQGPHVSFQTTEHSFDTINEIDGKVTHTFRFINMGSASLEITSVRSTCGCTAPDWTEDLVPPGGSGFVKVEYNPAGRPGGFSQMVAVNTNDEEQPVVRLTISGYANARPLSLEEKYPRQMESIRLQSNHLAFGKVAHNDKKEGQLTFANTAAKPVRITFDQVPEHIRLWAEPELLGSREEAVIYGVYDAEAIDDWGFVLTRVGIEIDGKASARTRLTVSADIQEDFDSWTEEQMNNAPKMVFKEQTVNLGKVKQQQEIPFSFYFTNEGKSDLLIRKVSSSCGCTVGKPESKVIAPGQSSSFNGTFSSEKRRGSQNMAITLITNDPLQPTQRVFVQSVVE